MSSLIIAIQLILIRQLGSLIERVSDKNLMEWIDHFQEKTKVSDAVAGELFQGLSTSFPEMALTFIPILFLGLNPVIGIAANVGSCVFNFMMIVGIPVLFSKRPLEIDKYEIFRSLSYYTILLIAMARSIYDGILSMVELSFIVLSRIMFMHFTILRWPKRRVKQGRHKVDREEHDLTIPEEKKPSLFTHITRYIPEIITRIVPQPDHKIGYIWKAPLGLLLALTIIGVSIYFLVDIVESLGTALGISLSFLSLTVLALITSLPELATNIPLAKKGKGDQILGNTIGSNSINLAIATGLMIILAGLTSGTYSYEITDKVAILNAIYMLLVITAGFIILLRASKRKLGKPQARILIISYFIYIIINYFNFQ